MPFGDFVNQLPMALFMVVHIALFATGVLFAKRSFDSDASMLGGGFTLFAMAELSYMTYHLDWTVFLFAHTISEVLNLAAFVAIFVGAVRADCGVTRRAAARAVPLALALALGLALSGCGGAEEAGSSGGQPVATNQVDLPRSYKFAPERIRVVTGEAVTWTNNDQFTHNVVLLEPEEVAVGTMAPGETASHEFTAAGTYTYQCTLHPRDMNGEVVVQ